MDGNSKWICPDELLNLISQRMDRQMWRVNGLMLVNAILIGVIVGIGAYAPRYRRHRLIRYIFLAASTLFLPIVSTVADSTIGSRNYSSATLIDTQILMTRCGLEIHLFLVLVWTSVVVVIGINTSTVVAGDAREGRNVEPPAELLIKAIWVTYLIFITTSAGEFVLTKFSFGDFSETKMTLGPLLNFVLMPLMFFPYIKMIFRTSSFVVAKNTVEFGRNPRFIVGHMADLCEGQNTEQVNPELIPPPAIVVCGEMGLEVEEQPHGYIVTEKPEQGNSTSRERLLVTLDRIWGFDDMVIGSQYKDLCFSLALFKLLRCRFAKYTVLEAGFMKIRAFFWATLVHCNDHDRVFQIIADELSFMYDYYFSSVPTNQFRLPFLSNIMHSSWNPFYTRISMILFYSQLDIIISLLSICHCLYVFVLLSLVLDEIRYDDGSVQIVCLVLCPGNQKSEDDLGSFLSFGNLYFDIVPVYLVLVALLLSEVKIVVSYFCSNWTKVSLICNYINRASWQRSPAMRKCIVFILKHCRCKLLNSWSDKMNQCSILVLHPWKIPLLLRRLRGLPTQKIKVPREVKAAVVQALKGLKREQGGQALENIRQPLSPISCSPVHENVNAFLACNGKGVADTILAWHIATAIFEVKCPQPSDPENHKVAAILSRYCAYLALYEPELLPDDVEWCKKLCKNVKKYIDLVLSRRAPGLSPEDEYKQLVRLLSDDSNHEVLKNGARLARDLVDSNTEWKALASFWSEMILYIAPSENLDAHAEAIGRGGELVTLLWALLAHAGIVGRLDGPNPSSRGAASDEV